MPTSKPQHHANIVFIGSRGMGELAIEFLRQAYGPQLAAVFTYSPTLSHKIAGYVEYASLMKNSTIPYFEVESINTPEVISYIRALAPHLIVVVAWSQIIAKEVLEIPKFGTIGFHASLLPENRGGSPVNWALLRGEKHWGTTMFYFDPAVDNGDIIDQRKIRISLKDDCKTVYEKVSRANLRMLKKNLPRLLIGKGPRRPQDKEHATYNPRRKPADGIIDWNTSTEQIYNFVRAQTRPYPGAFTYLDTTKFFIWKTIPVKGRKKEFDQTTPGTIVTLIQGRYPVVKTKDGFIKIIDIETEGKIDKSNISKYFTRYECFGHSSASR